MCITIKIRVIDTEDNVIGITESKDNYSCNEFMALHDGVLDHIEYELLGHVSKADIENGRTRVRAGDYIHVRGPRTGFVQTVGGGK